MRHIDKWLKYAEQNRNEKSGQFDTAPLAGEAPVDYGVCLASLTQAAAHLNEGIPNGQTERTLAAFVAASQAVTELGEWLKAKNIRGS